MSHSHDVEWISGSFIQSHWPWMTLCPSSMFSMILASESSAVPGEPGGAVLRCRTARAPADLEARCAGSTRRM